MARLTAVLVDARPGVVVVEGDLGVGKTRLLDEAAVKARGVAVGRWSAMAAPPVSGFGAAAVIVDDLQWAGRAWLELLELLVNQPPVVVLLGCRSGQFPTALRDSVERSAVCWLRLEPLPVAEVDRLLGAESPERKRALQVASGGNPRHLGILAAGPQDPADIAPERLDERLADALDREITDELRMLGDDQRAVLHAAAVLGDEVDLDLVAEVARLDEVAAAGAVDELVRAGLLREGIERLRFVHPLVLAAAYRLVGPGARTLAHRRAAECLHRRGGGVTGQARHLEYAAELGDRDAAEVLAAAAKIMLGSVPATSVRWLRVALRVLPHGPELAEYRSWLRVLLARALVAAGHLAAGQAELGDLRGLTGRTRPAAVRLLAVIARLFGDLPTANGLASTELRRISTPELRFELLTSELLAGRWSHAARSADALDAGSARPHLGLPAAAASLRTLSAVPGSRPSDLAERLRLAAELVDGLDDGTLCDVLEATVPLGWVQLLVDNVAEALRHVDRGLLLARRNGQRHVMAQLYPIRALAHCRNGSIAESLRAADEAVALARSVGSPEMVTFAQVLRLRPLWLREGPSAAGRAAAELDAAPRLGSTWHRMIADATAAEALLALGRAQDSRIRLQPWLVDDPPAMSALASGWYALLSRAYLGAGSLSGARRWLAAATDRLGDTPLPGQSASVDHAEAAALLAEHRAGAAAAAAGAAADQFGAAGFVVRAAQARMTLAEALLMDGHVASARRELGNARVMLADAGADWLAERAGRAQRRLGAGLPRPRQSRQAGLTTREREIAELVAQGMTNRVIAGTLFLSPRTVDAHLRRILTKLGAPNRAAVARHIQG